MLASTLETKRVLQDKGLKQRQSGFSVSSSQLFCVSAGFGEDGRALREGHPHMIQEAMCENKNSDENLS